MKIYITDNQQDNLSENAKEISVDSVIRIDTCASYSITVKNNKIVIYRHDGIAIKTEMVARNQIEI